MKSIRFKIWRQTWILIKGQCQNLIKIVQFWIFFNHYWSIFEPFQSKRQLKDKKSIEIHTKIENYQFQWKTTKSIKKSIDFVKYYCEIRFDSNRKNQMRCDDSDPDDKFRSKDQWYHDLSPNITPGQFNCLSLMDAPWSKQVKRKSSFDSIKRPFLRANF